MCVPFCKAWKLIFKLLLPCQTKNSLFLFKKLWKSVFLHCLNNAFDIYINGICGNNFFYFFLYKWIHQYVTQLKMYRKCCLIMNGYNEYIFILTVLRYIVYLFVQYIELNYLGNYIKQKPFFINFIEKDWLCGKKFYQK